MNRGMAWGLLAAWAVHDAEEWLTTGWWMREGRAKQRAVRVPQVSAEHERAAITVMAGIVAAVAARGAATEGRSRVFQAAVAGFGLHGFAHLGMSAVARGYTPGVATTPLVVLPAAGWAWNRLGKQGIRHRTGPTVALAVPLTIGALAVAHGTAAALRAGRPNDGARDIGERDDGRDAFEHPSRYSEAAAQDSPLPGVNPRN